MAQIDTTFHISDLLVVGSGCCTALVYIGRQIVKAVRHRLATIDLALENHGHRIGTLEEAKAEHDAILRQLGFRPGHPAIALRQPVEGRV